MKNHIKSVILQCPICGCEDFEFEEATSIRNCFTCKREFSNSEIIEHNSEQINSNLSEIVHNVTKEALSDLKKSFNKNWS